MTNEEADAVFDELMMILRKKKLEWIADQVAREIAEGRPVVETLTPVYAPKSGPFASTRVGKSRSRAVEFTGVQPYDSKSKLIKLITAIETTVASSAAMIEHLAGFLAGGQPFDIIFRGEGGEDSGYRVSDVDLTVTVPAGQVLQRLLLELEREVVRVD
ncbi:hypothetical protein SSBR45G_52240 [Bradyrhizobium sp. SSBR45G]|uniref:hypothetical protein n=1 Tax=unclassified Bradyrhizobium TaxID=2631580 RepID=UPI00234297B4|nr:MULTISPECIES: hypothetical protein [unclassified Bradyrhizobium]GLH80315.1 hypothetical protein SSBR45G_52240 [Bradyrhizobium sp. SSBR45G]GLH87809.1 hypothetical protein SSBR45R_52690 [Bradyrhizobium sp. SSBR45R]